jgi:hypothetical protein
MSRQPTNEVEDWVHSDGAEPPAWVIRDYILSIEAKLAEAVAALKELLIAVEYAAPPRNYGTDTDPNLCFEARVPVDFVTKAHAAIGNQLRETEFNPRQTAQVALAVLSDPENITDEMADAGRAKIVETMHQHGASDYRFIMRQAISAALAAAKETSK